MVWRYSTGNELLELVDLKGLPVLRLLLVTVFLKPWLLERGS